jgi:hypothetical protein
MAWKGFRRELRHVHFPQTPLNLGFGLKILLIMKNIVQIPRLKREVSHARGDKIAPPLTNRRHVTAKGEERSSLSSTSMWEVEGRSRVKENPWTVATLGAVFI